MSAGKRKRCALTEIVAPSAFARSPASSLTLPSPAVRRCRESLLAHVLGNQFFVRTRGHRVTLAKRTEADAIVTAD